MITQQVITKTMSAVSIPHIDMYLDNQPVKLHLSTRATATFVTLDFVQCNRIGMVSIAHKLDRCDAAHGRVLGEIECTVSRGSLDLTIQALVVQHLHVDILAGLEFMEVHEIALLPRRQVSIYDNEYIFDYDSYELLLETNDASIDNLNHPAKDNGCTTKTVCSKNDLNQSDTNRMRSENDSACAVNAYATSSQTCNDRSLEIDLSEHISYHPVPSDPSPCNLDATHSNTKLHPCIVQKFLASGLSPPPGILCMCDDTSCSMVDMTKDNDDEDKVMCANPELKDIDDIEGKAKININIPSSIDFEKEIREVEVCVEYDMSQDISKIDSIHIASQEHVNRIILETNTVEQTENNKKCSSTSAMPVSHMPHICRQSIEKTIKVIMISPEDKEIDNNNERIVDKVYSSQVYKELTAVQSVAPHEHDERIKKDISEYVIITHSNQEQTNRSVANGNLTRVVTPKDYDVEDQKHISRTMARMSSEIVESNITHKNNVKTMETSNWESGVNYVSSYSDNAYQKYMMKEQRSGNEVRSIVAMYKVGEILEHKEEEQISRINRTDDAYVIKGLYKGDGRKVDTMMIMPISCKLAEDSRTTGGTLRSPIYLVYTYIQIPRILTLPLC